MPALPASLWGALGGLFGLIVLDAVLGWLLALRSHTWQWGKAGQFLATNVFRYLGGGIVAAVVAQLHPTLATLLDPLVWVSIVAVAAKFVLGDIRQKVTALFGAATGKAA